jgi:hypothetical protein
MAPKKQGTSVLALELERCGHREAFTWRVVASVPGREGTFAREFGFQGRTPSEADFTDAIAWIQKIVADTVLSTTGVQAPLV